jgi:hypothetical protein
MGYSVIHSVVSPTALVGSAASDQPFRMGQPCPSSCDRSRVLFRQARAGSWSIRDFYRSPVLRTSASGTVMASPVSD